MADLIPNPDDQILERNDPDELLVPYPSLMEPQQLVKIFGYIPPQLAHSIDVHAPLFPISACIEFADDWSFTFEDDKPLTAEQFKSAKKYWVYYRRMSEYYKRVEYFNENPTEYYRYIRGTDKSYPEELASHWDEIRPPQ